MQPPIQAPRRRPWGRRILLIIAIAVPVLAVSALGAGLVLYDRATRIDRSQPDLVVSNYLRALLLDRDDDRAALHTCADPGGLAEIRAWRDNEIVARERDLNVVMSVSWGVLTVAERTERTATVTTDIRRSANIDGIPQSVLDTWRFQTVDENGWRVCGATRVS